MNFDESFREVVEKEHKVADELESLVSDLFVGEDSLDDRFSKLRDVHQLQKSIVKQNMHNAMSPISAISGYLELINMSLSNNPDVKQIEHYRKQIEAGVKQVNVILEQLMEIYSDESDVISSGRQSMIDVDLNWIVSEVCHQMHNVDPNIEFKRNSSLLHIHTDLFMAKLIIFNLISFAIKCSPSEERVEVATSKTDNTAIFSVLFKVSPKKKGELSQLMSDSGESTDDEIYQNSFNEGLITSRNLAAQIDSQLDFHCVNEDKATLNLSIPLCNFNN